MKESPETAQAAIMQLIEAESVAFLARDYEAWSQCWSHEPHVRRLGFSGPGGVFQWEGWEEYSAHMKRFMVDNPTPSTVRYHREAMNIRVGRDIAWATFDQIAAPAVGPLRDLPEATHEVWVMERGVEGWKVVCLCVNVRSLEHIASALIRVDRGAAVGWMNAAAEEELRTIRGMAVRAGRLRATDRAADQRLQAAIRWAGDLSDEGWARHGALPVVLGGGDGEPANVCWVVAHNTEIFVAINNRRMNEDRLAAAAAVYGITPAQTRLAQLIIQGHDLVQAAERLNVSVNTTRTHLQRMFEKTGVRSQPALVRVLLNVASPLG